MASFRKRARAVRSRSKASGKELVEVPSQKDVLRLRRKIRLGLGLSPRDASRVNRHTEAVRLLAVEIAKAAKKKGLPVNPALVDRLALLHDSVRIYRARPAQGKGDMVNNALLHQRHASDILVRKGLSKIALGIGRHGLPHFAELKAAKRYSFEEWVLDLADSRVLDYAIPSWDLKILRDGGFKGKYGKEHRAMINFSEFLKSRGVNVERVVSGLLKFKPNLKADKAFFKDKGIDVKTLQKRLKVVSTDIKNTRNNYPNNRLRKAFERIETD
jgi:hypothetical protein